MADTIADFNAFRTRMNDLILGAGNLTINRFFALDNRAYEPGALGTKTKEMLGLVSSLVLRCDDCVTYHVRALPRGRRHATRSFWRSSRWDWWWAGAS